MPNEEPQGPMSLTQAKASCVAHLCPQCGTDHQVSVEQVVTGGTMVVRCHCRACGHSWHPVTVRP